MTNEDVEGMVLDCLKERDGQGTTSIVRNLMLEKSMVSRALRRLSEKNSINKVTGNGSTQRGFTWCLVRNKNAPAYKLKTKKWDLDLFA